MLNEGIDALSEDELEVLSYANNKIVENPYKRDTYMSASGMQPANVAMIIAAVFVSLISIILLFNSMNIGFIQQVKQWGSMRAIGLTNKQLLKILIIEGLLYFAIGAIVGLGLGRLFIEIIGSVTVSAILGTQVALDISLLGYILSLLMSVVSVVASVILVWKKAKKLSPIQMMNYSENKPGNSTKHKFKNIAYHIARMQINRRKTTSLMILIMLVACNVVFAVLGNVFLAIEWPEKELKDDLASFEVVQDWIGGYYLPFDNDTVSEIGTAIDTQNIYAIGDIINLSVTTSDTDELIKLLTYNDNLFRLYCERSDILIEDVTIPMAISVGGVDASGEHDVSVSTLLAETEEDSSTEIFNGKINVDFTSEEEFLESGQLLEVDADGKVVIINEAYTKELYGKPYYNSIFFDTDLTEDEVIPLLNPIIKDFENHRFVSYQFSLDPSIAQLLAILFIAAILIAFILFVLLEVEINAVNSNLILYKKEYSIYRALGASLAYVKRLFTIEAFMISLVAAMVSVPIAAILSMLITSILLESPSINLIVIIVVALINVFAYCTIAKILSKKLDNQSIYEGVRME